MEGCFVGKTIAVRPRRRRRDGKVYFVIFRPNIAGGDIDSFESMDEANLVAEFVEAMGGSYVAKVRKAAKEHARIQLMQVS